MIRKSEAVVLYTRRFGETSIIAGLFTAQFGREDFIVKGYRSGKGRRKLSLFQPMAVVDIVYYHKDSRELQQITEVAPAELLLRLHSEPEKLASGIIAVDLFRSVIHETDPDSPLYHFLRNFLVMLDREDHRPANLFFHYILHLTRFAGFFPDTSDVGNEGFRFDQHQGKFIPSPETEVTDKLLLQLLNASAESSLSFPLPKSSKKNLLEIILQYYTIHVPSFRKPGSIEVFSDVFS